MRRKHNLIPKLNIKKNDRVKVISGNSRGTEGRVIEVYAEKYKVLVEGVNVVTKHTKPTADLPNGGRLKKEAPIHVSNVMLMDKGGVPTRVGRRRDEHGKWEKYSKKTGTAL